MATLSALRQDARAMFAAGVDAADPYQATRRHLAVDDGRLAIVGADGRWRAEGWPRVHVAAFGKAACRMAQAALAAIPGPLLAGPALVITNDDNARPVARAQVLAADHPLPDARGLAAALRLAGQARRAGRGELLLALISGGGSALIPCPPPPVTLADTIAVTELLLGCGAPIQAINCVRKHLSVLAGGGLARLAAPADVQALILSDVIGDAVSSIASGPTVADDTCYQDAIAVLHGHRLWERLPASVRLHLEQGRQGKVAETPKSGEAFFKRCGHTVVGSNALSVAAMLDDARAKGYAAQAHDLQVCGEARGVAERWALAAKRAGGPVAWVGGGETTVTVTGQGLGGRNQELALAFALAAERCGLAGQWVFLSGGSDGRDGPTDAAGGLVDHGSLARMRQAGIDPAARLADNDAYHALQASADLLLTGGTGTNVADLQVLLLNPGEPPFPDDGRRR